METLGKRQNLERQDLDQCQEKISELEKRVDEIEKTNNIVASLEKADTDQKIFSQDYSSKELTTERRKQEKSQAQKLHDRVRAIKKEDEEVLFDANLSLSVLDSSENQNLDDNLDDDLKPLPSPTPSPKNSKAPSFEKSKSIDQILTQMVSLHPQNFSPQSIEKEKGEQWEAILI